MNRFVLIYSVGDGFTYSADIVVPIEAESKEEIYVKLSEEALRVVNECEANQNERDRLLREYVEKPIRPTKAQSDAEFEKMQSTISKLNFSTEFVLFDRKFDAVNLTYRPQTTKEKKKGRTETIYGELAFDSSVQIYSVDEWFEQDKVSPTPRSQQ